MQQIKTSGAEILPPAEIAVAVENAMVGKATKCPLKMFLTGLSGGAFIAIGSIFYIMVLSGADDLPYGLVKCAGGIAFSLGLMLCVVAGADLFTSTTMNTMACASRRITWKQLCGHWTIIYVSNMVGALIFVALAYFSGLHEGGNGVVGEAAMHVATSKVTHTWTQSLVLGIGCNIMVCLAVWLASSGKTTTDKLLAVIFPVAMFVAAGFEHSIANWFILPYGWALGAEHVNLSSIILNNIIPVTIGNIIGGGIMVGMYYWVLFRQGTVNQTH